MGGIVGMDIFELPEVKIKEESVNRYETASISKSLAKYCLEPFRFMLLEATRKKWLKLLERRNQQN